jgi:hypothetical protein
MELKIFEPVVEKVLKEAQANRAPSYRDLARRILGEMEMFQAMLAEATAVQPKTQEPINVASLQQDRYAPTAMVIPQYQPIELIQPTVPNQLTGIQQAPTIQVAHELTPVPAFDISRRIGAPPEPEKQLSLEEIGQLRAKAIAHFNAELPQFIEFQPEGHPKEIQMKLHSVGGAGMGLPIIRITYLPAGKISESQLIEIPMEVSKSLMTVDQVVEEVKRQAVAKLFAEKKQIIPRLPPKPNGPLKGMEQSPEWNGNYEALGSTKVVDLRAATSTD